MWFLRIFLAAIAGLGFSLMSYGAIYNHFLRHPKKGDPLLAFQMLPLEIALGFGVGVLVFFFTTKWLGGTRLALSKGAQIRILYRWAYRSGGSIHLEQCSVPLGQDEVRSLIGELVKEGKVKESSPGIYHFL